MPKKLIDQWITQVELVAPGFFTIYKYHGDAKRHEPIVGERERVVGLNNYSS